MKFRQCAAFISLSMTAVLAHAGLSETSALVKNSPALNRYKGGDVLYSSVKLQETAVPGMYKALNPKTNARMFFVHEGLDYILQNNGWSEVKGQELVPVKGDPAQLALDKQMILKNLPLDEEMAYKLGDAKRRAVVVWDAVDCAHCRDFEASLNKYGAQYNATVYILPSALDKTPANTQLVRNAWCSANPGETWRKIMSGANVNLKPADQSCAATRTMETSDDIAAMLRIHGTPGFILGSVNGKAAISGFPPNSKPDSQKQMLDAIMGKR